MKVLFSETDLKNIVSRLAAAIATDCGERRLLLLGLLKGCQPFLGDLCRALSPYSLPLTVDYLSASSYVGCESSGRVTIGDRLPAYDWPAFEVIVVDDIFDTGLTLSEVVAYLRRQGAAEVRTCVLLRKNGVGRVAFEPDYCGAAIDDHFVVGYGLDFNERYRELPDIRILPAENQEIKYDIEY